jgi:hypothetical protein
MSKIKNIYCFGTSFTAGGGFEWKSDHPDRSRDLRKYYSEVNIEKTQEAFSWPGRFKDILKNKNLDIQVHNFGKQGYGNQRVYRKAYDVINNPKFDASSSIFIIELSWIMRREFYFYDIDDYIIANYGFLPDEKHLKRRDKITHVNLAHSYWYDKLEFFIADAKLSIRDETNGKFDDFHAGVFGNTLIASQIFNKIVDDGVFNESKVNPNPKDFLLNLI